MSWPLRIATLSKGGVAFAFTFAGVAFTYSGGKFTYGSPA